ncbi:MAG: hypothetical protein ABSD73_12215, partial [Candidatus Bathyarchaeia archaeon]
IRIVAVPSVDPILDGTLGYFMHCRDGQPRARHIVLNIGICPCGSARENPLNTVSWIRLADAVASAMDGVYSSRKQVR